jgi:hypothetical protein
VGYAAPGDFLKVLWDKSGSGERKRTLFLIGTNP